MALDEFCVSGRDNETSNNQANSGGRTMSGFNNDIVIAKNAMSTSMIRFALFVCVRASALPCPRRRRAR